MHAKSNEDTNHCHQGPGGADLGQTLAISGGRICSCAQAKNAIAMHIDQDHGVYRDAAAALLYW